MGKSLSFWRLIPWHPGADIIQTSNLELFFIVLIASRCFSHWVYLRLLKQSPYKSTAPTKLRTSWVQGLYLLQQSLGAKQLTVADTLLVLNECLLNLNQCYSFFNFIFGSYIAPNIFIVLYFWELALIFLPDLFILIEEILVIRSSFLGCM